MIEIISLNQKGDLIRTLFFGEGAGTENNLIVEINYEYDGMGLLIKEIKLDKRSNSKKTRIYQYEFY